MSNQSDEPKPMTRAEVLSAFEKAEKLVAKYFRQNPVDDRRFEYVKSEIARIRRLVSDHWPLTAPEKETIQIGLFAVRELEGAYDDLADLLEDIDYTLTEQ